MYNTYNNIDVKHIEVYCSIYVHKLSADVHVVLHIIRHATAYNRLIYKSDIILYINTMYISKFTTKE